MLWLRTDLLLPALFPEPAGPSSPNADMSYVACRASVETSHSHHNNEDAEKPWSRKHCMRIPSHSG